MSEHSFIYIILSVMLLLYSIRHRLDLLCVASVCYIVYSIYCIPGIGISGFYRPNLSHSLYYAVFTQLLIIMFFVGFSRYLMKRRETAKDVQVFRENIDKKKKDKERALRISFRLYTFVILAFAMMNIISVGLSGFAKGKNTVWEQTNVFYIISLYGAWPSFAYGIHKNDKIVWILSLFVELTIFFAGSRAFMTTIIVIFLCEKATILWKKRKSLMKIYILGSIGIVFLLLYRMVDTHIMTGDINGAINILKNPTTWTTALELNEPRVIIANYDYSLTSGLRLPIGDSIYRMLDFVPGLTSFVRIELHYPEYYSTWLMDQVSGSTGVGGSIWGESYVMFGYVGIIIFTLIWLNFIKRCNNHLDYHANYSYFVVSLGTYLAWYINRLDFNRVAQACKVMFLCFLIWVVVYLVLRRVIKVGKLSFRLRRTSIYDPQFNGLSKGEFSE